MEWTCRVLDLAAHAREAVEVQALAFGLSDDEVSVRSRIVQRHAAFPGARALGAWSTQGRLVGFVYGYPNLRDQWWSLVIEPHLTRVGAGDWLDHAFVVGELHVLPLWQRHGVGSHLLDVLCRSQRQAQVMLSALDQDTPARRMYYAMGFTDLAAPVVFPGNASPYTVMGATLPLRAPRHTAPTGGRSSP